MARELLLPLPERLAWNANEMADIVAIKTGLAGFLADKLADPEDLELWLASLAPVMAALPPGPAEQTRPSQQASYDRFFHVRRHAGGTATLVLALGQVLAELACEFQAGSSMSGEDKDRLLDGLGMVLEAIDEC